MKNKECECGSLVLKSCHLKYAKLKTSILGQKVALTKKKINSYTHFNNNKFSFLFIYYYPIKEIDGKKTLFQIIFGLNCF